MADKAGRKQLLKAWKRGEEEKARAAFPLTESLLTAFFENLQMRFEHDGCWHDTRHAQVAIDDLGLTDVQANRLLDWCNDKGGFCDCEIAANTRAHWLQNRLADKPVPD